MADNFTNESSEDIDDREFNEWASKLENMSDIDVSKSILQRVLTSSDLDQETKDILKIAHAYCINLIETHQPLDSTRLKIYLEQVKGYQANNINIYGLIILLGTCGIHFT